LIFSDAEPECDVVRSIVALPEPEQSG